MREYDPQLDITAGELRSIGLELEEEIPDCAWVPRGSLRYETKVCGVDHESRRVAVEFVVSFAEAFEWAEINFKVPIHE